jgi:hypothetical protein
MEGMGIGSHPGSTYGQVQDMPMDGDFMGDQTMPQPPQDNNQVTFIHVLSFLFLLGHYCFFRVLKCPHFILILLTGCRVVRH